MPVRSCFYPQPKDDTPTPHWPPRKEVLMTLGELTSHMAALCSARARAITSSRNEPIGRNFFVYKTRGWGNKKYRLFRNKIKMVSSQIFSYLKHV
jgi:hypothetical protein